MHPHIIFPGQRLKREILQGFPAAWGIGHSVRGWMDTNNFKNYVEKVFHPCLVKQGTKFPVIFFVDGHVSHKSIEVADVCQSLGIILISLYPNTTHITQPADVAVFKPLKDAWRDSLEQWRFQNANENFTLNYFGEMLQKAMKIGIKTASIKNGFRVCGLHPFTPDHVDFTKCLSKLQLYPDPSQSETASPENVIHADDTRATPTHTNTDKKYVSIPIDKLCHALDMIGDEALQRITKKDITKLSRLERCIKYFYTECIKPYVTIESNMEDYDLQSIAHSSNYEMEIPSESQNHPHEHNIDTVYTSEPSSPEHYSALLSENLDNQEIEISSESHNYSQYHYSETVCTREPSWIQHYSHGFACEDLIIEPVEPFSPIELNRQSSIDQNVFFEPSEPPIEQLIDQNDSFMEQAEPPNSEGSSNMERLVKESFEDPNTADKAQNKENVPFSDVFNLPPTPCRRSFATAFVWASDTIVVGNP